MPLQPKPQLSPEAYLVRERAAAHKNEYFRGEVFAMAGASPAHVLIVTNIAAALHGQLRDRPCRVYTTDLRVKVSASGLYTYPDVVVICGEMLFDSTKDYDRGEKFEQYRKIPSFAEYVLIAQDHCHVEHFVKQANGDWLLSETEQIEDALNLPTINGTLRLAAVYENVPFMMV